MFSESFDAIVAENFLILKFNLICHFHRHGVVVRASALEAVDLVSISLSSKKKLKIHYIPVFIHYFPA